jgi:phage-related protein
MAYLTFVPPKAPVIDGSPIETNARSLEAMFGDGYAQRMPDGINTIVKNTTLFWRGLTIAQAATIDSFLAGQTGTVPFIYQVPGDTIARQWICKKWTTPISDGVLLQMTADIAQDFSL